MLVLTRKVQESLIVGAGLGPQRAIKLTVLQIRGNRVKLGFTAGDAISIQRGELPPEVCDVDPAGPTASELEVELVL